MAANKFATMLHRNTNKITTILIYAVLEWTLIILLLLNSLFSYLIFKFANYFGLKPPCLWCSRVDHFFERGLDTNIQRDHPCEAHATEISKLGYCSNHQKLATYQDMCEECSSSRPDFRVIAKKFTLFSWVKEIGIIHSDEDKVIENAGVSFKCSCCGVSLENQIYSPYILINPSNLDALEYTHKENLITDEENDHAIKDDNSDRVGSDFKIDHGFERKSANQKISSVKDGDFREEAAEENCSISVSKFDLDGFEGDKVEMFWEGEREFIKEETSSVIMKDLVSDEAMIQVCNKEDASFDIHPRHLEFFIDCSGQQLVPIELVNSPTEEKEILYRVEERQTNSDHHETNLGSELEVLAQIETVKDSSCSIGERKVVPYVNKNTAKFAVFESMVMEETENSLVFYTKECDFIYEQVAVTRATQTTLADTDNIQEVAAAKGEEKESNSPPAYEELSHVQMNETEPEVSIMTATEALDVEGKELDVLTVSEKVSEILSNETEAEVSIGTEIPDLDSIDEIQAQENVCLYGDPSTSCIHCHVNQEHGSESKSQEETIELRNLLIELRDHNTLNNQLALGSELNGIEGEKTPCTPTSLESLHHLHKKLLLLERKESGTEESLDGSIISEFEGGDGVISVEHLTSALRAERKALHAIYAELEEERSASAVAANQTMAMINRLQEEKAAMQMEALQYQRMMEEQSEYDQEALQLLNEMMVKREREKQELEKELEIYRDKVLDFEAKEKMRLLRRSKDSSARSGFSSASFSNAEDSDGLSIDLNQEAKEENGFYSHHENGNNTPVNAVLNLEDSLADFEEERMSILEQLKVLEDKLLTFSEEEQHFEDIKPIEHFYQENGKQLDDCCDFGGKEVNELTNGFSKEMNGKHHQERISKGKSLLPLFDAISEEKENGVLNGHENGFHSADKRFELEDRKVSIEEEVDQLYARLQALEADREFLKHCISSLKKGDKGIDLLQEILQHLRDLRNAEIRVKNFGNGALV